MKTTGSVVVAWEYRRESAILSDEGLNAIGRQGWEMVTVTQSGGFVFKRAIGVRNRPKEK